MKVTATIFLPLCVLAALVESAAAQIATRTEMAAPSRVVYGREFTIGARVIYAGGPCPGTSLLPPMPGRLLLKRNGEAVQSAGFYRAFDRECSNGIWVAGGDFWIQEPLDFGDHSLAVEYVGAEGLSSSVSTAGNLRVAPLRAAPVPGGTGTVSVGLSREGQWYCSDKWADVEPASEPLPAPPAGVVFPFGVVRYEIGRCFYDCGVLCPGGAPRVPQQNLLVEYPARLPGSALLWQLTGSGWQPLSSTVRDQRAEATLSGDAQTRAIEGVVALGVTDGTAQVQDLWWSGPAENGWGVSIAQRGQTYFAVLYVYKDDGTPQWIVMPGGTWDAAHTAYRGDLYRPLGSWFGRYDPSQFRPGAPVGSARLSFGSGDSGTLEYTLDGKAGTKSIRRQAFAPSGSTAQGRYAGLWWGGESRAGWGLHVAHQEQTLFAVWYTYDDQGRGIWYVMPGGAWTAAGEYVGTLYGTRGSPWAGTAYDPARLIVDAVGTLRLNFLDNDSGSMSFMVGGAIGTQRIVRQPF